MKVLNPMWWWAGIKGAAIFAKENPSGFGFTWLVSGLQTMWTTAFPVSLAYPDWARELAYTAWPYVKETVATFWDMAWSASLGP